MTNKNIKCVDCGEDFEFTISEQQKYEKLGFQEPKRCYTCREERKYQNKRKVFIISPGGAIDC